MSTEILAKQQLFPHKEFRPEQAKFVAAVAATIAQGKQILIHAPTGLGKTASTLGPAISYAIQNKKRVFFLTSRHTQHLIALETAQKIQNMYDKKFGVVNLVGKQHLCLQAGINALSSSEFTSYCKDQREKRLCKYYTQARKTSGTLDVQGQLCAQELKGNIIPLELLKSRSTDYSVCPYEIALELSKESSLVVADYFYVFNDMVRNGLFKRAEIDLEDCIIIVDEAHNLASRLKELASAQLTARMLNLSAREAEKMGEVEALAIVQKIKQLFESILDEQFEERVVDKNFFNEMIKKVGSIEETLATLLGAGERVRDEKQNSFLLGLSDFIARWQGTDNGFSRILSKQFDGKNTSLQLTYACLDASVVTKPILEQVHSTIFMSGTLRPLEMYRDLLGAEKDAVLKELQNPFPTQNVLSMVVPTITTKYSKRTDESKTKMITVLSELLEAIPGNTAVFLPSYEMLETAYVSLMTKTKKTVFCEQKNMPASEKNLMIKDFASYAKKGGAILFGVASGSFGEGIDLPGDLLNGVIIVGVPLAKPTLEVKELIAYYQQKFGRGWDYGYLIPAFNVTIQNAGRCIRTDTDKGVIVYLDERYATQFSSYFPKESHIVIEPEKYLERIRDFFTKNETTQ